MYKFLLRTIFYFTFITLSFGQNKYEIFSLYGKEGLVDKKTLEIVVEPKYYHIINSSEYISLFSDEGNFTFDTVTKDIKFVDNNQSLRFVSAKLSNIDNNLQYFINKNHSLFLIKNQKENTFLGIEIPDSTDFYFGYNDIDIIKNNKPFIRTVYNIEKDNIDLFYPKKYLNELNIKTYKFNSFTRNQFLKNLENSDNPSLLIKNNDIPIEFYYLSIADKNQYFPILNPKNELIEELIENDLYKIAKNLYKGVYSINNDEFLKNNKFSLLQKAIEVDDLDFLKSIPNETLKTIKILDYVDYTQKNLLYYAIAHKKLNIVKYFVSIGVDDKKVITDYDDNNMSALQLIEEQQYDDIRKDLKKILK